MNESELLNKEYDFQHKTDAGNWAYVAMGDPNKFLIIVLRPDHTLDFVTNIPFYPEERAWEFDQERQHLIFKDEAGTKIIATYAVSLDDNYLILNNVADERKRYICHNNFDFNKAVQPQSILSRQRRLFVNTSQSATEKDLISDFATKIGYEVSFLNCNNDWQFIDQVWSEIAQQRDLKVAYIIFSGGNNLDGKAFSQDDTKSLRSATENRAEVLSALSQLLIMHNQQLLNGAEPATPTELLKKVIMN
ncbi:hypothetical protein OZX56_07570 [Lactobacillus sp. ESL0684]|uniref:hypothetical protein n=1 Tax=Lactobacillus sp. ESL0684 TaxID=2983213 RepID=UPI0023F8D747|nr:hypothetical protein [Lactobacillus sp. ESL0684]WEV43352.1 hypothetical protein OZX56_07570 [Lactobacillus sp. ESL0684]